MPWGAPRKRLVHDARMPARPQLLIAYDGSSSAQAAIRVVADLVPEAEARVLSVFASPISFDLVVQAGALPTPEARRSVAELAREAMNAARTAAEQGTRLTVECGLRAEAVAIEEHRHAWQAILDEADAHDVDLVASGARGRGALARALLGSTSTGLLHHTTRPLLIVPEDDGGGDGPIILAYDGSDEAREAIAVTARLFERRSAVVVHVWESPVQHTLSGRALSAAPLGEIREITSDLDAILASVAASTVEDGAALARGAGLRATGEALESSTGIWRTISTAATERKAALLVVGSRGRGGAASALLGSVSAGLVHNVEMPTLVVPKR
jgi:nucleotide-binding universal stress UspA family protein